MLLLLLINTINLLFKCYLQVIILQIIFDQTNITALLDAFDLQLQYLESCMLMLSVA